MPEDCLPSTVPPTAAAPTPAETIIAHAEALAEIATLLQHEPDREHLEELAHGLLVLGRRLAGESRAAGADTAA